MQLAQDPALQSALDAADESADDFFSSYAADTTDAFSSFVSDTFSSIASGVTDALSSLAAGITDAVAGIADAFAAVGADIFATIFSVLADILPFFPVVLDVSKLVGLPDTGINITQLSSSNTFFDMTGDGQQNLTAWAGAGNGILFFDPTGQGQLTQANQMIFTDWDPGATSDMQALQDVFDTNHDGALDSGDADFSKFFVMVTNASGTQTAYSLAQLGITSINLTANATNISLPDGSSIQGGPTSRRCAVVKARRPRSGAPQARP